MTETLHPSEPEYPLWSVITVTGVELEVSGILRIEYPFVQIIKAAENGDEIQFASTLDNVFILRIDA